ncbi:SAM-dependent methyltransferase [Catenuloplanes japonicus]|uniref:SAM-dependent methyltransferase n=1 Tax=Catenuloplanes japonicus TaxID=33876 RepID=UPI00052791A9|nr:SAM-dependent methyltransferase [Catenuloplanes japonicus]
MADRQVPPGIDTSTMHPARRYDYLLGGKDNFEADRANAEMLTTFFPTARIAALENRGFLRRAVTFLAREAGVRQFLDIGSGLPTAPNVHEVAQGIAPESRVVYVDNDPIVLVHARALLTSSAEGATAYVDADLRDPDRILTAAGLRDTLDLTQPVALMLVAVMHFFPEEFGPYGIVERLVRAMPSGSYLVMSNGTLDHLSPDEAAGLRGAFARSGEPAAPRTRAEFARFFDGLELVAPGITSVADWRADGPHPTAAEAAVHAGVARIP